MPKGRMNTEKICTGCGQIKNLSEYVKSNQSKDGYSYRCKQCLNLNAVEARKENKGRAKKVADKELAYLKFLDHKILTDGPISALNHISLIKSKFHQYNQYGDGGEGLVQLLQMELAVAQMVERQESNNGKTT